MRQEFTSPIILVCRHPRLSTRINFLKELNIDQSRFLIPELPTTQLTSLTKPYSLPHSTVTRLKKLEKIEDRTSKI